MLALEAAMRMRICTTLGVCAVESSQLAWHAGHMTPQSSEQSRGKVAGTHTGNLRSAVRGRRACKWQHRRQAACWDNCRWARRPVGGGGGRPYASARGHGHRIADKAPISAGVGACNCKGTVTAGVGIGIVVVVVVCIVHSTSMAAGRQRDSAARRQGTRRPGSRRQGGWAGGRHVRNKRTVELHRDSSMSMSTTHQPTIHQPTSPPAMHAPCSNPRLSSALAGTVLALNQQARQRAFRSPPLPSPAPCTTHSAPALLWPRLTSASPSSVASKSSHRGQSKANRTIK